MQEAEEQDTCRICSAPAEPDQPLFHPCKCSGTIRYIHQDCLTTWLAHSKKKTCDVCNHPYSFTKVYANDMPLRLPTILLARRLAQHAFYASLFLLRAIAVILIWLAVLPWLTVCVWRVYFYLGESTAWYISDLERPAGLGNEPFYHKPLYEPNGPPQGIFGKIFSHPLFMALSADIFTGQIIASLIVLIFVAIFLLREWISQNARPGVFEEEEFPDMPPAPPQPLPRPNLPQLAVQPLVDVNQFGLRQAHAVRELDRLRENQERAGREAQRRLLERRQTEALEREAQREPFEPAKTKKDNVADVEVAEKANVPEPKLGITFYTDTKNATEIEEQEGQKRSKTSSLPTPNDSIQSSSSTPSASSSASSQIVPDSPTTTVRRPPLAPSVISLQGQGGNESASPLVSPGLATYRAPEELKVRHDLNGHDNNFSLEINQGIDAENIAGPSGLQTSGAGPSSSDTPKEDLTEAVIDRLDQNHLSEETGFTEVPDQHPKAGPSHMGIAENEVEDLEEEMKQYFADPEEILPPTQAPTPMDAAVPQDIPQPGRQAIRELEPRREDEEDEEDEGDDDVEVPFWNNRNWDEPDEDEVEEEPPAPEIPREEALPAMDVLPDNDLNQFEALDDEAGLPPELMEDLEGNVEDDMAGAMEAIGLRGPIHGVFQNAGLMILVLGTAIGVGIWLPFTIGKTLALLTLNPRRIFQILHLPIKIIRLATDPIVDYVISSINNTFISPYRDFFANSFGLLVSLVSKFAKQTLGEQRVVHYVHLANQTYIETSWIFSGTTTTTNATHSHESILDKLPSYLGPTESYFASLGSQVRFIGGALKDFWTTNAVGSGSTERVFATILGYAFVGLLLAIYLNLITIGNARTATKAVRNAVRQQLLVFKVATFIFIELAMFPLGCGVILDLCTVWLFPEANINSRTAFFSQAPLTAMFYHWIAGTMFMYSFAVLLSGCRKIMVPGALWFIKDPQDQNSHPIRDILDRPTLTQLRKICMSGVMYSVVVGCVVGSVAGLLQLGHRSILPFRWKNREPLSDVPIDLVFLHLVLPYTMHYFRPKRLIKSLTTRVWKFLARRYRLTSYFFTERRLEEEYTPKSWFGAHKDDPNARMQQDGQYRRVPATDNVAVPRDMRATARTDPFGYPYDKDSEELMRLQDAEVLKARRNIREEFRVVYIPPNFRSRIFLFILSLWVFGALVLGISVALPITLGRGLFRAFTMKEVHDGYSLIIGFYLIIGCYLCGRAVDRLDKRRQRRYPIESRTDLKLLVIKRGILWLLKISYMMFALGVVLPMLVAVVMELYVILPIQLVLNPNMVPKLRIVNCWTLGLLYIKIAMYVYHPPPTNRVARGIQQLTLLGWIRPDPVSATRDVIAPLVGGLLGMIVFPGAIFRLCIYMFPWIAVDDSFIFLYIYPSLFIVTGLMQAMHQFDNVMGSWSQTIRDKEFLVEMRLRNHEPEVPTPEPEQTPPIIIQDEEEEEDDLDYIPGLAQQ